MKETWRWFGQYDKITLQEIRQTGATGIVSSLHDIPYGEVWSREAIAQLRQTIESAGLSFDVVESLPVHESLKLGAQSGHETNGKNPDTLYGNYRQSMVNLASEGITTICYNFMPLLDWTRTTLNAPVANGGTCLRFDMTEYAAFDLFMLQRKDAEYSDAVTQKATRWWENSNKKQQAQLTAAIMAGLPGAYERYTAAELRAALAPWQGFTADDLRCSLARFLSEVIPTADEYGIKMCIHPDDPPRSLFGLPRIVSDKNDLQFLKDANGSLNNGITLCSGSLGANPVNDVAEIAATYADRIHFAHLRNVRKDDDGSFQESAHLAGDNDMPAVIDALLTEEARREKEGRRDAQIPYRPDHGHELLSDESGGTHPGYPLIGRLRGLAELRGVVAGLRYSKQQLQAS